MNHKLLGLSAVLGLSAALTGCLTSGELGGGTFGYRCDNTGNDAVCEGAFPGQDLTMPRKIAVGSVFLIDFFGDASSNVTFTTEGASPEYILPSGSFLQFQKAGYSAVLSRTPDGRVGDFVHLRAVDIDHLSVLRLANAVQDLKLSKGQSVTLLAVPQDETNETLAGAFTYTWSTTGPDSVVEIAYDLDSQGVGKSNSVILTGVGDGAVDLVVQTQSETAIVHITVGG